MKKLGLFLVVILVVSSILTGCTSEDADEPSIGEQDPSEDVQVKTPEKDTVVIVTGAEPSTLDGNGKNDNASLKVRTQIYEHLVAHD